MNWQMMREDDSYRRLTEMKTSEIVKSGYHVTGYILRNEDGSRVCLSEHSAVRWMPAQEMFNMMHCILNDTAEGKIDTISNTVEEIDKKLTAFMNRPEPPLSLTESLLQFGQGQSRLHRPGQKVEPVVVEMSITDPARVEEIMNARRQNSFAFEIPPGAMPEGNVSYNFIPNAADGKKDEVQGKGFNTADRVKKRLTMLLSNQYVNLEHFAFDVKTLIDALEEDGRNYEL